MEQVELTRSCEAIAIPAGHPMTLEAGTLAFLTQSLGGSFTLQVPEYGGLFRIAGKDADAIGKERPSSVVEPSVTDGDLEQQVCNVLTTC